MGSSDAQPLSAPAQLCGQALDCLRTTSISAPLSRTSLLLAQDKLFAAEVSDDLQAPTKRCDVLADR